MLLIKPDAVLIDHGHFQYNSLILGLIMWSLYALIRGRRYICCIIFTIAINAKVMSVYYSLAFMGALIGYTLKRYGWHRKERIMGECAIYAGLFILTTTVLWLPWLTDFKSFKTVIEAIFPVHRGLYQLKVPNFWCISDVIMKWESWASKPILAIMCFVSCVLFSLPSIVALIVNPSPKILVIGFSCISMTFFMFSYHVHEKSILLPLLILPFTSQYLLIKLNSNRKSKENITENNYLNVGGKLVIAGVVGGCAGMYHLLKEDNQKL